MSDYHYFPLSSQSHIRLLRLLPKAEGDHDELCGELVEYDLMLYDDGAHPYEALSYCWESEDKPCVLMIHGKALAMTRSLYTALVRLRHFAFERVLWIDAVCIDQPNDREKESQIPLMGEIFAKAQSVLVWLGEECDSSSLALGAIVSAAKNAQQENVGNLKNLNATTIESIQRLLKRPWFSRIWVVQEITAARRIEVLLGASTVDGNVFSLGVRSLGLEPDHPALVLSDVIHGASFRSRQQVRSAGRLILGKALLWHLFRDFCGYQATKLHDNVYALFGICLEDLHDSELKPDYSRSWASVMVSLVHYLVGSEVTVTAWDHRKDAIIVGWGSVIGMVVATSITRDQPPSIRVAFCSNDRSAFAEEPSWTIENLSRSVRKGDVVCILHGSTAYTIVRLVGDYFKVIDLVCNPSHGAYAVRGKHRRKGARVCTKSFAQASLSARRRTRRSFVLVWECNDGSSHLWSRTLQSVYNNGALNGDAGLEGSIPENIRDALCIWNTYQILHDLHASLCSQELMRLVDLNQSLNRLSEAVGLFRGIATNHHTHVGRCLCTSVPLWTIIDLGNVAVVDFILHKTGQDPNAPVFGRTLLSIAAELGDVEMVKYLLSTSRVDCSYQNDPGKLLQGYTHESEAFRWCAMNGHLDVLRALLGQQQVGAAVRDNYRAMVLAAEYGHEEMVDLLLDHAIEEDDLSEVIVAAAKGGHIGIVKLLINRKIANIDDCNGALADALRAAASAHVDVVQIILAASSGEVGIHAMCAAAEAQRPDILELLLRQNGFGESVAWEEESWRASLIEYAQQLKFARRSEDFRPSKFFTYTEEDIEDKVGELIACLQVQSPRQRWKPRGWRLRESDEEKTSMTRVDSWIPYGIPTATGKLPYIPDLSFSD